MSLNIKKLETTNHPPVTSVKLALKVRRLTTEDSAKGDYAQKSKSEENAKNREKIEDTVKVSPIKKLDLL